MFHPESNPLAPKPTGPLKPEKELVRVWLGDAAAELMEEKEPETGDEDLNFDASLTEKERRETEEVIWPRSKYIKWAESFGEDAAWVDKTFVFHKDGTTNTKGGLLLSGKGISFLPRGLKRVMSYLILSRNRLTSLEGLPQEIGSYLNLSHNQLTSLVGLPRKIKGDLNLVDNQITSLEGLPKEIEGDLYLEDNPVESIPAGLVIAGSVFLRVSQTALAKDAKLKGYRVEFSP